MIPVAPQPEPAKFDAAVRQPGLAWLNDQGHDLTRPLPKGAKPPPHWRKCLDDLHGSYGGVCAYLAIYLERATGAATADHFVAKSALAGQTYEWSNYRLVCLAMNARKQAFDDVLDPFTLPPDVFRLELVSGRLFVNPALADPLASEAEATRQRLQLDNSLNRATRARHYDEYLQVHKCEPHLRKMSPFVWYEARRQGLLL